MDDERLKNPPVGSSVVPDYFDEMLERIRDIRASERRVYLRVREIFALAADYQPSLKETTQFFKPSRINCICLYRAYRCGTHPQTSRCQPAAHGLDQL